MARVAAWARMAAAACGPLVVAACSLAFPLDKLASEPPLSTGRLDGADAPHPCAYGWRSGTGSPTGSAYDVALADFDRDGELDLAVANAGADGLGGPAVFRGRGGGVFEWWSGWTSQGLLARSIAVGDINADGRPDVAVALDGRLPGDGMVAVSFGTEAGTLGDGPRRSPWQVPEPYVVEIGDLDGDHVQDLVLVANFSRGSGSFDDRLVVLKGLGEGEFAAPVEYGADLLHRKDVRSLAVADVTGDGIDDVIVTHAGSAAVTTLIGGPRGLVVASTNTVCGTPWGVAVGDFDGDHVRDLVVACNHDNGFMLLTGSGGGLFTAGPLLAVVPSPATIAVADLNADGLSDVVLVGEGQVGFRLATGGGAFGPAVTEARGAIVKEAGVALGDIDHDGVPDVIVAGWSAEVPISLNGVCR